MYFLDSVNDGIRWCYSRPVSRDDPDQGWKLHISATIGSACEVIRIAEAVLIPGGILFKRVSDLQQLLLLNSGAAGFSQIGKFLTVYPSSTEEGIELARELHELTRSFPGPRIPFDLRYRTNSNVYYRYGSFRASATKPSGFIRAPDGKLYPDLRGPKKAVPAWIKDPFARSRSKLRKPRGPIGLDYLVYEVLAQRGKGGVYVGIDLSVSPPRKVIIKEGRRHGETDRDGRDAYARLKHEGRVVRRLCGTGIPVPEIYREFSQNGNRYLVLEPMGGPPLLPAKNLYPPKFSWRRAAKILGRLEPLLAKMHAAGWVWRDCKPSHIFVEKGGARLIDFEIACRICERRISPWGSPDYLPAGHRDKFARNAGTLEDDYALGVIAFQFLAGEFPPQSVQRRRAIYRRTGCPDSLRERIETLLRL